ncbi:MAG: hypothetical protein EOP12_01755 [Pseudomonas sp.]|nr:MAG: hypothetical protein EOP12_01755 [Pseudomonas sp.]
MNTPLENRVVVIAASMEGIDALARLISQLPSTFPLPMVVHVHGLRGQIIVRLKGRKWRSASKLDVVYAQDGDIILAGRIYVIPAGKRMVFSKIGTLSLDSDATASNANELFESAASWYQSGVIGVVLSGLGTDGTHGLKAITKVDGTRIIQSPSEATFSSMPSNALLDDHVQHSVLLDQLGPLLISLTEEIEIPNEVSSKRLPRVPRRVLTSGEQQSESLDRSIGGILSVMREQLRMDIVLVTKKSGDEVVVSHSTDSLSEDSIQGLSMPKDQTLCQRVLDGHLPAVIPDVETMRLTHDVPATPIAVGAYMAAPVWLKNGDLYGTLCCLSAHSAPELDKIQYQRLQMSARQIARLVNEAGVF